ncbi:unnamed protein product [Ixodes hexagonus]
MSYSSLVSDMRILSFSLSTSWYSELWSLSSSSSLSTELEKALITHHLLCCVLSSCSLHM